MARMLQSLALSYSCIQISFQILVFILRNFASFSTILTEVAFERKICNSLYWNLREKEHVFYKEHVF